MSNSTYDYSQLSDRELIERLTSTPVDEKLHSYFFTKKCRQFLKHISSNIYRCGNENQLLGEFYEFISKDNWAVLRKWQNKNGASLYTYLAFCATNYFVQKQTAEKKMQEHIITEGSLQGMYEQLTEFIEEEEEVQTYPVWEAFYMLNQRDQTVLRQLVIDDNSALDAAPAIWKFIKNKKPLSEMAPKRVQGTIAMAKHRAQLTLFDNLKLISRI